MMVEVTICCPKEKEEAAAAVAHAAGMTLEEATMLLWDDMIDKGEAPLPICPYEPNDETKAALRHTQEMIDKGVKGKVYNSVDEMFRDLDLEEGR